MSDKNRVSLSTGSKAKKKQVRRKTAKLVKLYRKITREDVSVHMETFMEMAVSIAIDLSFQSRHRWNDDQMKSFLESCVVDLNISKFVLVDVGRCLKHAILKGDVESQEYFQRWYDLSVKYLNVDSNNRTTSVKKFVEGELSLPHGRYELDSNLPPVLIDSTNNTYETLPKSVKNTFHSNLSSICMITAASREQLSDVFERMNSGESLNEYEKINCVYSDICAVIRDLADNYSETFSAFFKETEINRRKLDHWISICCLKFFNGIDEKMAKKRKSKMYERGSIEDKSIGSFKSSFTNFIKKMGKVDRLIRASYFFDLFYLTQEEIKLNKNFESYDKMKNDFISMISELHNDKTPKFVYVDSGVSVPFKDLNGYDPVNANMRLDAYKSYGFDVSNYSTQLDSKRTGSRMKKLRVAERDGYTLNDGTKIDPDELFSGKYDLGHKVAHIKGGTLDLDNLVIQDMSDNRSQGSEETVVSNK